MSYAENAVPDRGALVYLDLVRTDFGEFTPGSQDYAQLIGHLGSSGLFGEMLAERLEEAGQLQGEDATVLSMAETQLSGDRPHAFSPRLEIGAMDENILRIVNLEVAERMQNEAGDSPQADGLLLSYYGRQVRAGVDSVQYWMQVNRARRHIRSQLN